MIYKWAEPDDGTGSGTVNPLDRVEALLRCTNDNRLIQWICQRGRRLFHPQSEDEQAASFLSDSGHKRDCAEFADLLAVIATAASDNQITAREAATIRARWEELKTVTEGFVHAVKREIFRVEGQNPRHFVVSQINPFP